MLGVLCGFAFRLSGQAAPPLLLAIVFMSTSAGLLLPVLKDADEESTRFGQLVMTASALAEIAPIMLLSLLFSAVARTSADRLMSLGIFIVLLVPIGLTLARVRQLEGLDRLLYQEHCHTAQPHQGIGQRVPNLAPLPASSQQTPARARSAENRSSAA